MMNTHNSVKWGVHIIGNNKFLAADCFEEAANKCKDINKAIISAISIRWFSTSPLPLIYANIIVWSYENGEHKPELTNWDELC